MSDQHTQDYLKGELPRQKWFKERVGKRLFRTRENGNEHEPSVYVDGLIVFDEFQAQYLFDCENELKLKYFDSIEERDTYEKVCHCDYPIIRGTEPDVYCLGCTKPLGVWND